MVICLFVFAIVFKWIWMFIGTYTHMQTANLQMNSFQLLIILAIFFPSKLYVSVNLRLRNWIVNLGEWQTFRSIAIDICQKSLLIHKWHSIYLPKELKTRSFTRPSSPCLCNYSAARNICAMSAIDVLFMSDRNINASTGIILALLWIVRIDWICTEKVTVRCAVMVYTRVAVFESLNY